MDTILFKQTDSSNPDFLTLVALLDQELNQRYGEKQSFFDQFNKVHSINHVIVVYQGTQPVACGAIKEYAPESMEVKRMFVIVEHRGRGIAREVLKQLELWAAELEYTATILETGKQQPEAIQLYQKAGYLITENYGQYIGVETSVCMRKELKTTI